MLILSFIYKAFHFSLYYTIDLVKCIYVNGEKMAKQTGSPRKPGKRGKTRSKFKKSSKKISVNDIMQEFEDNDKVQVVIDSSYHPGLPDKGFHGLTGNIVGKRGKSFEVKLNKGNKEMMVVTTAVHLKKLK